MQQTDVEPSPVTDLMANWYMQNGLTPAVVEHAYRTNSVRGLAISFAADEADIRGLADRWGIQRRVPIWDRA